MVLAITDDFSKSIEKERLMMSTTAEIDEDGTNEPINLLMQFKEKNKWMHRCFSVRS